ncbi:Hypothetical_protein [Hexamita inflata]|uniref:Hypothetical_protein n=1 Tax=Hexamita inflata TaxID=28002 RepID=A0ABP1HHL8_9EUKA
MTTEILTTICLTTSNIYLKRQTQQVLNPQIMHRQESHKPRIINNKLSRRMHTQLFQHHYTFITNIFLDQCLNQQTLTLQIITTKQREQYTQPDRNKIQRMITNEDYQSNTVLQTIFNLSCTLTINNSVEPKSYYVKQA